MTRSSLESSAPRRAGLLSVDVRSASGARPFGGTRIALTSRLTTGARPDVSGLHRLAWDGCAAVIDLRSAASRAADRLPADAAAAGLRWEPRPIAREAPDAAGIALLVRDLRRQREAAYMFCEDGRLSLMIGLMADERILTEGHLFARMAGWGAPLLEPGLRAFATLWYAGATPPPPASVTRFD